MSVQAEGQKEWEWRSAYWWRNNQVVLRTLEVRGNGIVGEETDDAHAMNGGKTFPNFSKAKVLRMF